MHHSLKKNDLLKPITKKKKKKKKKKKIYLSYFFIY